MDFGTPVLLIIQLVFGLFMLYLCYKYNINIYVICPHVLTKVSWSKSSKKSWCRSKQNMHSSFFMFVYVHARVYTSRFASSNMVLGPTDPLSKQKISLHKSKGVICLNFKKKELKRVAVIISTEIFRRYPVSGLHLSYLQWNLDMFAKRRILISRSFSTYFTIPGVKKIVRYTKDFWRFVLSRFHCTIRLAHKSSSKFFSSAKRKLELFLPEPETRSEGLRESLLYLHTNMHTHFIVSSPKGLVPDALLPVLTSVQKK